MYRLIGIFILASLLASSAVMAETVTCPDSGRSEAKGRSSDPAELAAYWIHPIEDLYSTIPTLSPKEKRWLDEELGKNDRNRTLWALDSREYTLRMARLDIGNLLASLRVLNKLDPPGQGESLAQRWRTFVYDLIDYDGPLYLAKLVTDDIIEPNQIPKDWSWLSGIASDFTLQESIRANRLVLARHILACVMPKLVR
jgi:hypothetical protein